MRLHLFECICARCLARFKAPELFGGYGVLQLRSAGRGAEAFVDTFTDTVFDEVSQLVDGVPDVSALGDHDRGGLVQAVFGVTCDPDSDGTPFVIGAAPRCPNCGSRTMSSWKSIAGDSRPPQLGVAAGVSIELAPTESERRHLARRLACAAAKA